MTTQDKPDIESLSREFCKLGELEIWHEVIEGVQHPTDERRVLYQCSCFEETEEIQKHCGKYNPDFTDARELLRVMRAREDWPEFVSRLIDNGQNRLRWDVANKLLELIEDTTGLLLKEAVEFLRKRTHECT